MQGDQTLFCDGDIELPNHPGFEVESETTGQHSCPLCYALFYDNLSTGEIKEPTPHSLETTWPLYTKQVAELRRSDPSFIIVIMNYSGKNDTNPTSILNFTVLSAYNQQSCYDYYATTNQGPEYLEATLEIFAHAIEKNWKGKKISLWSDGNFKTYGTVHHLRSLAQRLHIDILHHYFAPHPGHSLCDAHFGRSRLRNVFGQHDKATVTEVIKVYGELCGTYTWFLRLRQPKDGHWERWETGFQIRQINRILYQKDGSIYICTSKHNESTTFIQVDPPIFQERAKDET